MRSLDLVYKSLHCKLAARGDSKVFLMENKKKTILNNNIIKSMKPEISRLHQPKGIHQATFEQVPQVLTF